MGNKDIFANNLKKQMELNGKTRNDICAALEISYFTVSDWVNGKKYPRMDKVERLAEYFGIPKSDLIEERKVIYLEENNTDPQNNQSPDEPQLTEGEEILLSLFRRVPEDQQQLVLRMIQSALESPKQ